MLKLISSPTFFINSDFRALKKILLVISDVEYLVLKITFHFIAESFRTYVIIFNSRKIRSSLKLNQLFIGVLEVF